MRNIREAKRVIIRRGYKKIDLDKVVACVYLCCYLAL